MRIVFITGSRDIRFAFTVRGAILRAMDGADAVYHGACRTGVDALAAALAHYELEIETHGMPARWKREGERSAGPRRNERMAKRAAAFIADGHDVVCCAFPWRESKGTRGCIELMRAHGVPTTVFGEEA